MLAYDSKHRGRILPDRHRDAVYERRNLRIKPSYLIDGLVAGTWTIETKRREAIVTLTPLKRLTKANRGELVEEAERVARAVAPDAKGHGAAVTK